MRTYIDPKNPHIVEFISAQDIHKFKLELDISNHEALINDIQIKYESPIELTLLLKYMCNELQKININVIIQQVTDQDWVSILKDIQYFEKVNRNDTHNFLNIKCNVVDFPMAFMISIGYNPN